MKAFDAGRLDQQVTIEQLDAALDAHGHKTTWSTFATVWAQVEAIGGREALVNKQIGAEVTHRVTLRFLTGLTAAMRIDWGGKKLDIETIKVLGRDEIHELLVVERENA